MGGAIQVPPGWSQRHTACDWLLGSRMLMRLVTDLSVAGRFTGEKWYFELAI